MKAKHVVYWAIIYLLGGLSLSLGYATLLCYYLFCKGFMVHTYYPTFIEAVSLTQEYGKLKSEKKIRETVKDGKFRMYLKDNKQFVENRLWFLYNTDRDKYQKQIEGASSFAFIVFPLILVQYFSLRKLNKHLRNRTK